MSVPFSDLTVKMGDTTVVPLTIYDSFGGPQDISLATVTFRVWAEGENTDVIGPRSLIIDDGPLGEGHTTIEASDLEDLDTTKKYWYDVQIVGGTTVVQGRLFIEPDRVR